MLAILFGVVLVIGGSAFSFLCGPTHNRSHNPSWKQIGWWFFVVVVSWVLILTGAVFLGVGIFELVIWMVG